MSLKIKYIALMVAVLMPVFDMIAATGPAVCSVSGTVVDDRSGEPLAGVVLRIGGDYLWTVTDENGHFSIDRVQPGEYMLESSFLGYVAASRKITVKNDIEGLEIRLVESTLAIREVVVTAQKAKDGLNTQFSLDRNALNHLQVSNLSDMSALLPGGKTINPDLTSENVISLRTGGVAAGNAAFGTAVEVDGVRIGNNAGFGDMGGVGTRSIAVENIESVEVVTGVPSAEYGDLNSGMVRVNTRRGRTPVNVVFSVNPRTYQASVSKGIDLQKDRGVLNLSGEWARATKKLTSPYTSYSRRGFSAVYSNTFAKKFRFEAGFTGNIGGMDSKSDPDAYTGEYEKARDNVFRGNVSLTWLVNKSWITSLKFDASANFQDQRSRHYLPDKNSGTMLPAVHSEKEGYYVASMLPTRYVYDQIIDSKELDYAASVKYDWHRRWDMVKNNLKAGIQWKATGNAGRGEYFTDPSLAAGGYRPRPYYEYPYMHNLAVYIEDVLSLPVGKTTLDISAGLRLENVFVEGSVYRHTNTLSPRFNARWHLNGNVSIRGGWGVTEKLPSFYILYPKQEYRDIQTFSCAPAEGAPVYVYYTQPYKMAYNPDLKWQRNSNAELGIDAEFLGTKVSLVGFYNLTKNPYRYSSLYTPFSYNVYRIPSGYEAPSMMSVSVDSATGAVSITGPDGIVTPMDRLVTNSTFVKQLYQSNGKDILRTGAELVVDFPEIRPIRTSFRLDGSWTYTSYVDDMLSYWYPEVSHTSLPDRSYQYVGIYANGESSNMVVNGRKAHGLDANITAITHIPQARLIVTCRLEMSLLSLTRNISSHDGSDYAFTVTETSNASTGGNIYDGNSYTAVWPVAYMDLDGNVHPFGPEQASDPDFKELIRKSTNVYTFAQDGYGPYFSANISITKEIGDHVSVSFFANNFTNSRKAVTSYATGVSKIATPMFYYGLTCRLKF